jgi:hypothetical protein
VCTTSAARVGPRRGACRVILLKMFPLGPLPRDRVDRGVHLEALGFIYFMISFPSISSLAFWMYVSP